MKRRPFGITRPVVVVLFVLFSAGVTRAQHTITGSVRDAETGEPLQGVNVFLDQTTFGAATGGDGVFSISNLVPGSYRVVASMIGYEVSSRDVEIVPDRSLYRRDFDLNPTVIEHGEIIVEERRPRRWRRRLERFERVFLGTSQNAEETEILNPYVLDFELERGTLTARASAPLVVENRALGYDIKVILTDFRDSGRHVSMAGPVYFDEKEPATLEEAARWRERRAQAYRGSLMHLFRSLVAGNAREEGFYVAHEITPRAYGYGTWRRLELSLIPFLEAGEHPHLYRLTLENNLYVEFGSETSRIHPNQNETTLHADGYVYTRPFAPPPLTASGDLSKRRLADMLPRDYGLEGDE